MEDISQTGRDPLDLLKEFTSARIALGRVGDSIPLEQSLNLKLAHAHARDAVYATLETEHLVTGLQHLDLPFLHLHSKVVDRQQYLQRPDLGRHPDDASVAVLKDNAGTFDVCIVIADGLSALAINRNVIALMNAFVPLLKAKKYKIAPLCFASQARVAFGDHVGFELKAKLSVMLIGERPGLSSADSIGAYLTYDPKPGLTDEGRNCISNIRPMGLPFEVAASKMFYLINEAFKRKLSGVQLKDNAVSILNDKC